MDTISNTMNDTSDNQDDLLDIKCGYSWCKYVFVVFLAIVFTTGLIGNLLVLRIMLTVNKRSSSDIYIIFLTLSDLTTIALVVPVHILRHANLWADLGSNYGCKFHYFTYTFTYVSSAVLFVFIGLDRYLKIFFPYTENVIHKRPSVVSLLVFGICVIIGFIRAKFSGNSSKGLCLYSVSNTNGTHTLSFIVGVILIVITVLISIAYGRIILRMRRAMRPVSILTVSNYVSRRGLRSVQGDKMLASSRVLIVMSTLFVLCTTLSNCLVAAIFATPWYATDLGSFVSLSISRLYYINVCINPLIYYKMNSEFRKRTHWLIKSSPFVTLPCHHRRVHHSK